MITKEQLQTACQFHDSLATQPAATFKRTMADQGIDGDGARLVATQRAIAALRDLGVNIPDPDLVTLLAGLWCDGLFAGVVANRGGPLQG